MEVIERILSRPVAKPYRSKKISASSESPPQLNKDGHLEFSENDIENPKNWSSRRRWFVTVVSVVQVVNCTFASSGPSGATKGITEGFKVSEEAAGLVTTLFLLGYVFGPLFWAPLSEFYGRRYVYYITFSCYFAFNFLCAFTPNFGGLLVGRFLTGTFAAAPLSNVPGTLADLWGPVERGKAIGLFSMMTFIGPALGPVTGGFLDMTVGWRWVFYELLWFAFGTLILIFMIPETLPSMVLYHKARRIRAAKIPGYENVRAPIEAQNRTLAGLFKVALTRPWIILLDPISFLVAIYISVVYCLLYMLFSIYPIVFQEKRGWNQGVGELPLIGTVVGACIGGAYVFWDAHRLGKKIKSGTPPTPEDRLPMAMIGAILFPVTMFWFAWTANFNSVPWIVCTLAGVFLATSILLIFVAYISYLTDVYLMFAASALAANTIARSATAAAAPLFTNQMFSALGVGGGGSLIGGVACLLAPTPFLFYRYGRQIRIKSRFAPTEDREESKDEEDQDSLDEQKSVDDHSARDREAERELDEEAGVEPADYSEMEHEQEEKVYSSDEETIHQSDEVNRKEKEQQTSRHCRSEVCWVCDIVRLHHVSATEAFWC